MYTSFAVNCQIWTRQLVTTRLSTCRLPYIIACVNSFLALKVLTLNYVHKLVDKDFLCFDGGLFYPVRNTNTDKGNKFVIFLLNKGFLD